MFKYLKSLSNKSRITLCTCLNFGVKKKTFTLGIEPSTPGVLCKNGVLSVNKYSKNYDFIPLPLPLPSRSHPITVPLPFSGHRDPW
jgi:hypothetical protein